MFHSKIISQYSRHECFSYLEIHCTYQNNTWAFEIFVHEVIAGWFVCETSFSPSLLNLSAELPLIPKKTTQNTLHHEFHILSPVFIKSFAIACIYVPNSSLFTCWWSYLPPYVLVHFYLFISPAGIWAFWRENSFLIHICLHFSFSDIKLYSEVKSPFTSRTFLVSRHTKCYWFSLWSVIISIKSLWALS